MIDRTHSLPVTRQCQLLSLNRSSVYYQPIGVSDEDLRLMRLIDEIHLKRPFYGSLVEFMTSGPVVVAALERELRCGWLSAVYLGEGLDEEAVGA